MIEIPPVLIKHLQGLGPHFCLVEKNGKNPNVGGKEWQNHPMNHEDPTLQTWLKEGGNYGVVGGWGLTIIDVDSAELKEAAKKLPETFTVESPGHNGWHLYYLCNLENPIRLRDKEHDNIGDVQGPGKQVVGPGCKHPNGGTYKVINEHFFAQTTPDQIREVFKPYIVPEKEYRQSVENAETAKFSFPITKLIDLSKLYIQGNEYQGPHPIHSSKGGRNFSVNIEKNVWHCWRHETGGGPLQFLAIKEGIIKCEEATQGSLTGANFRKTLNSAVNLGLLTEQETRQEPTNYFESNETTGKFTFIPKLLADVIMAKHSFKTRRDSAETYVYKNGVYKPYGPTVIREECIFELEEEYRKYRADEVVDYIKSSTYDTFEEPPLNLLNVDNGTIDLFNLTLTPHTPKNFFLHKLPVKYDKTAMCPLIDKFLTEVTRNLEEKNVLLNYVAYTFYRRSLFHKALMLIGVGSNGKSVFLNMVQALLGPDNVSNRSLQELSSDKFATSDLYGKLANVCGDLPNTTIRNTGTFKTLVGDDMVTAQKKFIGAFKFRNYAKLLFSTNQPPESENDESLAFYRRWILITFPRVFLKDKDPTILQKITTPTELSGLLTVALDHLQALIVNNGFEETQTVEEIKEAYTHKSNPIKAFVEDCIIEDLEGHIEKRALYNEYARYCNRNNFSPEGKTKFENKLRMLGISTLRETRIKNKHVFNGVVLSNSITLPKMPKNEGIFIGEKLRGELLLKEKGQKNGIFGIIEEGRTCGQCALWHKGGCQFPGDPNCVTPTNPFAVDCKSFFTKESLESEEKE